MENNYYKALGIDSTASLEEVKKAFKKQARLLHPDVNKNIDAHEQFIFLNEAYQYIQNKLTGKVYNNKQRAYTKKSTYSSYDNFAQTDKEESRKRAAYFAKRKYQHFKESPYYKRTVEVQAMADQVAIVGVFIFISILVIGGLFLGPWGIAGAIFLLITSAPNWVSILKSSGPFDPDVFVKGVKYLLNNRIVQISLLTIFNIFIFLTFIVDTLIQYSWLIAIYITASVSILGVFRKLKYTLTTREKHIVLWGVGPTLVNLFFVLNYLGSYNERLETYHYRLHSEYVSSRTRSGYKSSSYRGTSLIKLDSGVYDQYPSIRFFFDIEKVSRSSRITYRIEDGLFGFEVVKEYNLTGGKW